MKLIIDIPEEEYELIVNDEACGLYPLTRSIANGVPHETVTEFADRCKECGREKVLDKIRADIEKLDRYYDNDYFSTNNCPMYKCNEVLLIIDKYKAKVDPRESEGQA